MPKIFSCPRLCRMSRYFIWNDQPITQIKQTITYIPNDNSIDSLFSENGFLTNRHVHMRQEHAKSFMYVRVYSYFFAGNKCMYMYVHRCTHICMENGVQIHSYTWTYSHTHTRMYYALHKYLYYAHSLQKLISEFLAMLLANNYFAIVVI